QARSAVAPGPTSAGYSLLSVHPVGGPVGQSPGGGGVRRAAGGITGLRRPSDRPPARRPSLAEEPGPRGGESLPAAAGYGADVREDRAGKSRAALLGRGRQR